MFVEPVEYNEPSYFLASIKRGNNIKDTEDRLAGEVNSDVFCVCDKKNIHVIDTGSLQTDSRRIKSHKLSR